MNKDNTKRKKFFEWMMFYATVGVTSHFGFIQLQMKGFDTPSEQFSKMALGYITMQNHLRGCGREASKENWASTFIELPPQKYSQALVQ